MDTAYLTELFSSVQGEGLYVGARQIFVRLYGCHLSCSFCDTPESVTARQPQGYRPASCRVEEQPGSHEYTSLKNPVAADSLLEQIQQFDQPKGLHHSIVFTGGEPLVQVNASVARAI